ncbi:MAG: ATP-binding protein [Phycisphaerae bacterium]|jgi:signal transduction histidine kinase
MIDLAMHMMDIVQNSIRAGAKKIGIDFIENNDEATLLFRVTDDGSGMNEESLEKLHDPFYTTRTTRRVGLGVPFLKMTCEQTGGYLKVQSEEGKGTFIEAAFRTDNPDCLPLGDIAGYLTLLLRANADIHFRFTYNLDELDFTLDSEELNEQGIELQHAEMLSMVKQFIRENLQLLYRDRSPVSYLC